MEHRTLGNTGLQVPVIGMGTWQTFDVKGDAAIKNARAIVDTAFEVGANFFDSSPCTARPSACWARRCKTGAHRPW